MLILRRRVSFVKPDKRSKIRRVFAQIASKDSTSLRIQWLVSAAQSVLTVTMQIALANHRASRVLRAATSYTAGRVGRAPRDEPNAPPQRHTVLVFMLLLQRVAAPGCRLRIGFHHRVRLASTGVFWHWAVQPSQPRAHRLRNRRAGQFCAPRASPATPHTSRRERPPT